MKSECVFLVYVCAQKKKPRLYVGGEADNGGGAGEFGLCALSFILFLASIMICFLHMFSLSFAYFVVTRIKWRIF